MTLEFHPLANLFPLIEGEEFDALVAGMRADGFRSGEEIILYEGKILDGRNRYRAALAAGIVDEDDTPKNCLLFSDFSRESNVWFTAAELDAGPLAYVLSKNLNRRHLNESQRAIVAARIATMRQGERTDLEPANLPEVEGRIASALKKRSDSASNKVSQADAAKSLAVSERSLRSAKSVLDHGSPELVAAVDQGKIAVSLAAQAAKLPEAMQQKVVEEAKAGRANAVRTVVKREARNDKEKRLSDKQNALPDKRYGVILADPEWRFEPYSRDTGMDRAPDNHYPTSKTIDIVARPVGDIAAEDCALFLWATAPMLPQALLVMAGWGFEYRSHAVWVKEREGRQRGPGYWLTGEHEVLLIGTRGHVPAPAPGTQWGSVILAPVGGHSQKPDLVYELIESYFPNLPKIELNARRARDGWDAWGNEIAEQSSEETSCPQREPVEDGEQQRDTLGVTGGERAATSKISAPLADPEVRIAAVKKQLAHLDEFAAAEAESVELINSICRAIRPTPADDFDLDRDMPAFLRRGK